MVWGDVIVYSFTSGLWLLELGVAIALVILGLVLWLVGTYIKK